MQVIMNEAFFNPIKTYLKTQPVNKAWCLVHLVVEKNSFNTI